MLAAVAAAQAAGRTVVGVGGVDDVYNRVHAAAVALPHRSEARLATKVPQLDCDFTLCHLAHVEADGGDHIL